MTPAATENSRRRAIRRRMPDRWSSTGLRWPAYHAKASRRADDGGHGVNHVWEAFSMAGRSGMVRDVIGLTPVVRK